MCNCPAEMSCVLKRLFSQIWREEKIPDEWLQGIIVKLPKKGDMKNTKNWREVTLLVVALKIFARGSFERIQDPIEAILRKQQAGFRRGKSTSDQIFVMRRQIEEAQEHQRSLVVNFVGFVKAFDSVYREALWGILREYGVPEKLIRMIKIMYDVSSVQRYMRANSPVSLLLSRE